jgi:hypothetical protein
VKKHHAQREQIGLLVERIALDLLRAHVGRRAHAHDEGRVRCALLADVERQAEIGDLHVIVLIHQDVGGLDVPMHDALTVGVIQAIAHLKTMPITLCRGRRLWNEQYCSRVVPGKYSITMYA